MSDQVGLAMVTRPRDTQTHTHTHWFLRCWPTNRREIGFAAVLDVEPEEFYLRSVVTVERYRNKFYLDLELGASVHPEEETVAIATRRRRGGPPLIEL